MNWIELMLSAVALILAAAAFRKAWSADPRKDANEVAVLQAFQDLRTALDALPGRIADEVSASPLREAMEGVRESVRRLGEGLGEQMARQTEAQAQARQTLEAGLEGLARGQETFAGRMEANATSAAASLKQAVDAVETSVGKVAAEVARIPGAISRSATEASQAVVASTQMAVEQIQTEIAKIPSVVSQGSAEVVRTLASSAERTAELVGQEVARSLPVPDATAQDALVAKLEELATGIRELSGLQQEIHRDSLVRAQAREREGAVQIQALESIQSKLEGLALLESIAIALDSANAALESMSRDLPVRIAQESAARPAPHPELEELAMAVRDSGHLRGDVGRQVAEAVGR
ncbi:MAG TPA: hypothetical protein PKY05_09130, partial [Fibrobacteria bacterium]|nr:hypothetical protein [Fibrobacteria bacterium]